MMADNIAAIRAAQDKAEERADASRQRLYEKVDSLRADVHTLDKRVEQTGQRLDDVEQTATSAKEAGDDYRRVVQQGKGALLVIGFGGSALGASLVLFFDGVVSWFKLKLGL